MRFVAGQGAGAQNHREANQAQVRQIAGQGAGAESHREDVAGRGAAAERLQRGGTAAERLCGRVPDSAGNVSPWIAAAAKKPPVTALWERATGNASRGTCRRERAVRRILFAGFEALCVFGYLELVYHLLNLTIHKDRKVVG